MNKRNEFDCISIINFLTTCFLLILVLIKVIFDALNELLKGKGKDVMMSAIFWHLLSMSQSLLIVTPQNSEFWNVTKIH
jgi:hypothetical protein